MAKDRKATSKHLYAKPEDPEAKRAKAAAYYQANRERIWGVTGPPRISQDKAVTAEKKRAYNRRRYAEKREQLVAQMKEYQASHANALRDKRHTPEGREKSRQGSQRYRANHPEKARESLRRSRQKNLAAAQARTRAARKAHPEYGAQAARVRRARKHQAPINDFTHAQWVAMQDACNHRCYYCHKRSKGRLTQDHILPLAKGGSHTLSNIVPACRTCNTEKGIKPPTIPVQPFLLL